MLIINAAIMTLFTFTYRREINIGLIIKALAPNPMFFYLERLNGGFRLFHPVRPSFDVFKMHYGAISNYCLGGEFPDGGP